MEGNISDVDSVGEKVLDEIGQILIALKADIHGSVDESAVTAGMKTEFFITRAKEKMAAILNPLGIEIISFDRHGLQLTVPIGRMKEENEITCRFLINKKPPFGDLQVQFQMRTPKQFEGKSRKTGEASFATYTERFSTNGADYDSSSSLEKFLAKIKEVYKDKLEFVGTPVDIAERLKIALGVFERYMP